MTHDGILYEVASISASLKWGMETVLDTPFTFMEYVAAHLQRQGGGKYQRSLRPEEVAVKEESLDFWRSRGKPVEVAQ